MKKRFLSILLVIAMVFTLIPIDTHATEGDSVYISISDDAEYVCDANGNPMAYKEVTLDELATIDLADFDLNYYAYDANGDGEDELTALHLYLYIHTEVLGLNWSDVYVTGGAGSLYFAGGLFGFSDENLRYDYNGSYPSVDGWGLTADQIVLSDGDFFNIAHYSSWAFWGDSATGFHYFTDAEGNLQHTYDISVNEELELGFVRSYSDWANGGVPAFAPEEGYTVYYGTTYGTAVGNTTTDSDGKFSITFPSAGTWYVWTDGGYGMENSMDIVSAPAFATVNVKVAQNPDQVHADAVETKIAAIGTVTSASGSLIEAARTAYDALSDEQKALVENYDVLVGAEETLAGINADMEAAEAVDHKINAIGTVTIHSGNKISAARKAYDNLTDAQKSYVENLVTLTAAEQAILPLYAEAAQANHESIYEATRAYIGSLGTPYVGSTGGEWMVIDLTRAGYDCPEGYYENVVAYVKEHINDKEQLHRSKSTDNSRVILALTAAGYDVTDVDGHNLLVGLTDMSYVTKQGINGPIWALIAFDSHNYEIPTNPDVAGQVMRAGTEQVTRERLISYILSKQLADGGWALSGEKADPDITGMAMQALAPYYDTDTDAKAAVDKAIICLSELQYDNGGFGSIEGTCSESCAQVIVALTTLGINPETDARFVKNGVSVVDAMCLFALQGGGFEHMPNGGINGMATEQAQYALVSYFRFLEGKTSLYDMSDVTIRANNTQTPGTDEDKDISKNETSDKDFSATPSPQTGDDNMVTCAVIMLVCALGCILAWMERKYKFLKR